MARYRHKEKGFYLSEGAYGSRVPGEFSASEFDRVEDGAGGTETAAVALEVNPVQVEPAPARAPVTPLVEEAPLEEITRPHGRTRRR